jgi:uncharacterized membrane protein YobD (UPF0266 family)
MEALPVCQSEFVCLPVLLNNIVNISVITIKFLAGVTVMQGYLFFIRNEIEIFVKFWPTVYFLNQLVRGGGGRIRAFI